MANVKITELTELAAVDLAENDVLPIVDVGSDATKKVTIVSLRSFASANDFATYTNITANLNIVQTNVAAGVTEATAIEARRAANVTLQDTATTAVEARRAANVTLQDTATAAVETRRVANVTLQDTATAAVETRRATNATSTSSNAAALALGIKNVDVTSQLTALGVQIYANVDIVQDNVASVTTSSAGVEARRVANIAGAVSTITTGNLTASKALVSDGSGKVAASSVTSTVLGYLDATSSVQTQLDTKISTTDSNSGDAAVEARRAANVTLQDTATTAVEARRTANIAGAVSTITTGNLTASKALVSDGSGKVAASSVTSTVLGYLDATSSVQTQLNTKISTTDANAIETRRAANVTLQDTATAAVETRRAANVTLQDTAATAVEARRAANIAGAISTVTTSNLGTAKALVSDSSGKIAVSSVTTTTLGYLDATSSIQTQIDAKAPLASPTFSGLVTAGHDLVITGNLTVNGLTTTINSTNKVIQDRFIMLANAVTGTPSSDVGIFLNRGTSGNAAIYYDESTKSFTLSETRDPESNTVIAPTGAANLVVGAFSASTISYNGADLNTAITANVSTLTTEATAIEARRAANIAGAVSTITTGNLTASKALVSDGSGKVAASSVTSTVLGYLDATSSVQTQLNTKISTTDSNSGDAAVEARRTANIAGAVSTITTGNLATSRAIVSDGSGKVAVSDVTATEVGYLDGVSSAIQTQLNAKQASLAGATLDLGTL